MLSEQDIDAVYKAHANALFSYALSLGFDRETSMDAIHDVFCKLCAERDALAAVVNMRFYLLRSLKNRLLDLCKRKRETIGLPLEKLAEDLPFDLHATVEDELIAHEEQELAARRVNELLATLTDRQREIVYLRYSEGLDYEEIARLMSISAPACRKLMHKALKGLRES
ncbi:MAG: sigma-70 family RNA polymerase sigma factor [Tannerellaceae bacterium]|jgi:RNA polymerase sigma factor (sigma-70 family)|nr:sigma-70 family RNA polymerase sigma factor [Tannerellaceae bacterium]